MTGRYREFSGPPESSRKCEIVALRLLPSLQMLNYGSLAERWRKSKYQTKLERERLARVYCNDGGGSKLGLF